MQPQTFDFIFIGNEHPIKGIDILDYILDSVYRRYKIALIGDLPKLRDKYDKYDNYSFMGMQTGQYKINVLTRSKVLILPSYQESFSMVACEALTYGVPVIAFNLPTLKTIYDRGMIFVPYADKKAMLRAMVKLMTHRDILRGYVEDILNNKYNFSWKREARKVIE